MPGLASIDVGDDASTWSGLGFSVDGQACSIGGVVHHLAGTTAGAGVTGWCLEDAPSAVDGLVATPTRAARSPVEVHPNGTVALDHLVVSTPDLGRTIAALEDAGLDLRRTRDAGRVTQAFFKLGAVVLEVVGSTRPSGDGPARFWGLAFTVEDLDHTAKYLGDRLRPTKDAVQPGRRIATLDRDAGSSVAIAFMSA